MMLVLVLLVGVWFLSGFVCLDLFVVIAFAGLVYCCCGGFRFLVCLLRLIVLEALLLVVDWLVCLVAGGVAFVDLLCFGALVFWLGWFVWSWFLGC